MTLHHSDPWLDIHGGDCRDVLATLPAESVHCVVSSPPYWGLRSYGVGADNGELGCEATPEEYVANMVAVFRAVRRVLRDDGTVWLNLGDSYAGPRSGETASRNLPGQWGKRLATDKQVRRTETVAGLKPKDLVGIPWRVAFALQADGWFLRSDIIWAKPNPMPESVTDRPTRAHEYLFLLTKSARYWYDADAVREPHTRGYDGPGGGHQRSVVHGAAAHRGLDEAALNPAGRNRRSVWTVATQPYPGAHFAVMPEALVEPCILAGCPDQTCSECGAPWERVVERGFVAHQKTYAKTGGAAVDKWGGGSGVPGWSTSTTTGWKPTCAHDAPTVPGVALDCFGGSGTVARVANRLSRRAILIDLSPDYLKQQMERTMDMPLGLVS
jgi:DNA modification methylase